MRPLNISASQAGKYYYEKDPIFDKPDQGIQNSKWYGNGAKKMGLSGNVRKEEFSNLIAGADKSGKQIIHDGMNKNGEKEHRAGTDIPFSPPKSVSVMGLHCDDAFCIQAHTKAKKKVMDYIEKNYVYSRESTEIGRQAVKTNSAIFACFDHSTSRANDPQLHSHIFLMNMTQSPITKGEWKATWNDKIFQDQTLLTSIYSSEVAREIGKKYKIDHLGSGKWEIAGIPEVALLEFSERSEQIDKRVEELSRQEKYKDFSPGHLRTIAVLDSRDGKTEISENDLRNMWEEKNSKAIINKWVSDANSGMEFGEKRSDITDAKPQEVVRNAYKILHDSQSVFSQQELLKSSLAISRGKYGIDEIEQGFNELKKSKELCLVDQVIDKYHTKSNFFASQDMIDTERHVVDQFKNGKDQFEPLMDKEKVQELIKNKYDHFSEGQKRAVEHILTTKDQFSIIQGDAGTGKTTAMKAVLDSLPEQDKESIIGLGFTGKAALELENNAGISSTTIDSFLNKKARPESKLWIVDESSMVGSYQKKAVLDAAVQDKAIVIFVGDGKQFQPIGAGKLFKELQDYKISTVVEMKDVFRQKADHMKEIVRSISDFQQGKNDNGIDRVIEILKEKNCIDEWQTGRHRTGVVLARYFSEDSGISHDDRLIISPVNKDRKGLNNVIIHELRKSGDLGSDSHKVYIREPVSLSGVNKCFAFNYEEKNSVFISKSFEALEIQKEPSLKTINKTISEKEQKPNMVTFRAGAELKIIDRDICSNHITVGDKSGTYKIDLVKNGRDISVFKQEERYFCNDQKIVFLKNDKKLGVLNGVTGKLKSVDAEGNFSVVVKLDEQIATKNFNIKDYAYFDHGYAVTNYKSQGQTTGETILVTTSKLGPMNNTEAFYVAATRAKHNFVIVTDDIGAVKEQFKSEQAKSSTLREPVSKEHVGEPVKAHLKGR